MAAHLPDFLRPVTGVDCIRVGPDGDGGYVIPREIPAHVDWLVSLGLGADWRFEAEFQELSGAPVTVYDHTVTTRFWARRAASRVYRGVTRTGVKDARRANPSSGYLRYQRFFLGHDREHRRTAVGDGSPGTMTMAQILADCPGRSVFLKMDVEGAEWATLPDMASAADRIVAMSIEFHDVTRNLPQLRAFLAALEGFVVVNTAANNVAGLSSDGTRTWWR